MFARVTTLQVSPDRIEETARFAVPDCAVCSHAVGLIAVLIHTVYAGAEDPADGGTR